MFKIALREAPHTAPLLTTIATIAALLSGCALTSVEERQTNATKLAASANLQPFSIKTKVFTFSGHGKYAARGQEPVVYIEGDGFAWIDRYTISKNPTPINPIALKLARLDPSPTVIYLARPCQYVDLRSEINCTSKYWTSHRFAPEIIDSYDQALTRLKTNLNVTGFRLVGFSGGGAIVALLSARRNDISSFRTIAGNLDHDTLNREKRVSKLSGSLNPKNHAAQTSHIPQIHFVGDRDAIIPEWVAKSYAEAAGNPRCVRYQVIHDVDHTNGWERVWRTLSSHLPEC
ncbi:alpha/beta fold hydrolase [Sneathiella aquimaris]|uniref:alpha/beta fold hydrolase n=1 Tax=Sneathiella aquimaris TaxID=2599305 RepID=UPI00146DB761|nr:alpha/beta hydrolase [Sneathiella aquimaris]